MAFDPTTAKPAFDPSTAKVYGEGEPWLFLNATPTPEQSKAMEILEPQERDMQTYIAHQSLKHGTNFTPEIATANAEFEYGKGATPQTALAEERKASKWMRLKTTGASLLETVESLIAIAPQAPVVTGGMHISPNWKPPVPHDEWVKHRREMSKIAGDKIPESWDEARDVMRARASRPLEGNALEKSIQFLDKGGILLADNAPNLLATKLNPALGMTVMYANEKNSIYDSMESAGIDSSISEEASSIYGMLSAPVEYAESLGRVTSAFGVNPKKGLLRAFGRKLKNAGVNVAEEALQKFFEDSVFNAAVEMNNEKFGTSIQSRDLKDGYGETITGSLAMTTVLEALGLSVKAGGSTVKTLGDANRVRKTKTDQEIDQMVEEGELTPQQAEATKMDPESPDKAKAVDEANKALFEEQEAAVSDLTAMVEEANAKEQVTTPQGAPVVLGEGFNEQQVDDLGQTIIPEGERVVTPIEIEDKGLASEAKSLGLVPEAVSDYKQEAIDAGLDGDVVEALGKTYTFSTADGAVTVTHNEGDNLTENFNAQVEKQGIDPAKYAPQDERVVLDIPQRELVEEPKNIREVSDRAQKILNMGEKVKDVMRPFLNVTTRIAEISPRIARGVRAMEQMAHMMQSGNYLAVQKFSKTAKKAVKSAPKENRDNVLSEIMNGDWVALEARGIEGIPELRMMFQQTAEQLGIESFDNYFRRQVKDYDGLVKYLGREPHGPFKQALMEAEKRKGSALSQKEKEATVRGVLKTGKGNEFSKKRTIKTVTPEMVKFYEDPFVTLDNYIRKSALAISKSQLLGTSEKISDELGETDTDAVLDETIDALIAEQVEEGSLTRKQEQDLKELLKSRLNYKESGKIGSAYRRLVSMKYVTRLKTMIKQVADVGVAMNENGIMAVASSPLEGNKWMDDLNKAVKLSLENIGVNVLDIELQNGGRKRIEELVFKPLTAFDKFGKGVLLQSTARRWRTLANKNPDKLKQILMEKFKDEVFVNKLMGDLKQEKLTADVSFALYSQMADFHPVSHSEHIKFYMDNPNMRFMFVLKSFAYKRLDRLYRESLSHLVDGTANYAAAKVDGDKQMAKDSADQIARGSVGLTRFLVYSVGTEVIIAKLYNEIGQALGWIKEPVEEDEEIDDLWVNMYIQELSRLHPHIDPYGVGMAIERRDIMEFANKTIKLAEPIGTDALMSFAKGLTDDEEGLSLDEYTEWKKDIPYLGEFMWGKEKAEE